MKMYEKILKSINLLVQNSIEMQDKMKNDIIPQKQPLSFAKEFCTIKVCSARRSGHSTAISKFLLSRCSKNKEKWALLSYNHQMSKANSQTCLKMIETESNYKYKAEHLSLDNIKFKNKGEIIFKSFFSNSIRGYDLDGIIVDCATLFNRDKIDQLYNDGIACMNTKEHKLFIFIE